MTNNENDSNTELTNDTTVLDSEMAEGPTIATVSPIQPHVSSGSSPFRRVTPTQCRYIGCNCGNPNHVAESDTD